MLLESGEPTLKSRIIISGIMFEEFKPDGSYDDTPDDIMRSKKPGASGIRDQA
jgi:hypothetical protein